MTATARRRIAQIATETAIIADLVIISGYDVCGLCPRTDSYLFLRADEYGDEVRACEHCVNTNPTLTHVAE